MTTKALIINILSGHWSLVIFALTLSLVVLRDFKQEKFGLVWEFVATLRRKIRYFSYKLYNASHL